MTRSFGSIYTPEEYAHILSQWAIRNASDVVLDLGLGTGAFVFAAYNRLVELQASAGRAQEQIYGAEIDEGAFNELLRLASDRGLRFPNLQNIDFFKMNVPYVDAVIGNPPYVRRSYLKGVTRLQDIVSGDPDIAPIKLSSTSDLYIYFLLYSLRFLKPGGRLAVITSDSWLNVAYGEALKEYVLKHLVVQELITFDRRVFDDAQVKPVLILAEKRPTKQVAPTVNFVRVKNGLPGEEIRKYLATQNIHQDIVRFQIPRESLRATDAWSINFKAPGIYKDLATHPLMTQISDVAKTRIGLQTLAKDFFVLDEDQLAELLIEEEFLQPIVQSLSFCSGPVIQPSTPSSFHLFYCSRSKHELHGTRALDYINYGETKTVAVRGKQATVTGYQNKQRIQEARRRYWYDLRTDIERRGRAEILIPRLISQTYFVVWNRAKQVPGELFIEFIPSISEHSEVYLAILNSTVMELVLRANAQVYGGGTYNISPGAIKGAPILSAERLSSADRTLLVRAYKHFLTDQQNDRTAIDAVVGDILELEPALQDQVRDIVADMRLVAASSKKSGPG